MDTDFYKGVVLSLVRFALSSVAGVLVTRGVLTADQTEGLILAASGAVFGLVTLAWVWLKSKAQAEMEKRQIQIALKADPATTSVAGVKLKAKTGVNFEADSNFPDYRARSFAAHAVGLWQRQDRAKQTRHFHGAS